MSWFYYIYRYQKLCRIFVRRLNAIHSSHIYLSHVQQKIKDSKIGLFSDWKYYLIFPKSLKY